MTCEAYRTLLERALCGDATPAELDELRRHEQTCSDCAELHRQLSALQNDLASLEEDVPPMPEDFHQRWTALVQEDAMESKKNNFRHQLTRFVSVAAALVFVIGGTLITRNDLAPREQKQLYSAYANSGTRDLAGGASMDSGTPMLYARSAPTESAAYDYDDIDYEYDEYEIVADEDLQSARPVKIIRTASLTIATRDYDTALQRLRDRCTGLGGWISYSSETISSGLKRMSMTVRIPTDRLDEYLTDAGDAGRVTARTETADDVSDSYYDTQTRLATQRALMDRLQSLIVDAATLSDLLELESQIANTQYSIDRLTSTLQSTDQKVNYATVTITLREEKAADELTQTTLTLSQRILSALETGWLTFTAFLEDLIVFLIAALPFLALVTFVVIVVKVVRKRRRK